MIDVYKPASGVGALAIANAMASGSATIPIVTPAPKSRANRLPSWPCSPSSRRGRMAKEGSFTLVMER